MGVHIHDDRSGGFYDTVASLTWKEGDRFGISRMLNHDYGRHAHAVVTSVYPVISGYHLESAAVEDLTIDGTVEGNIQLKENSLTIGPNGIIKADINAKKVTIIGEVQGNVTAEETVEIRETGKLRGNIVAPRLVIADGAFFKGSVEMERKPGLAKDKPHREEKPASLGL